MLSITISFICVKHLSSNAHVTINVQSTVTADAVICNPASHASYHANDTGNGGHLRSECAMRIGGRVVMKLKKQASIVCQADTTQQATGLTCGWLATKLDSI